LIIQICYKRLTIIPNRDTIGYRESGTEIGSWKGAFVSCVKDGKIIAAFFDNNQDYIAHPGTWKEVDKQIDDLQSKGWIKMTPEDILKTAGI
jgi:hypothetical protein